MRRKTFYDKKRFSYRSTSPQNLICHQCAYSNAFQGASYVLIIIFMRSGFLCLSFDQFHYLHDVFCHNRIMNCSSRTNCILINETLIEMWEWIDISYSFVFVRLSYTYLYRRTIWYHYFTIFSLYCDNMSSTTNYLCLYNEKSCWELALYVMRKRGRIFIERICYPSNVWRNVSPSFVQ